MSRRFTDDQKWIKKWVRRLTPELKLAFVYILDVCDRAGFWEIDTEAIEFNLGVKVTEEDLKKIKDFKIKDGWLFVTDFISFQYPKGLKENNNAHIGVIAQRKKMRAKLGPMGDPQDKDKDKDTEKEKDKGKVKEKTTRFVPPTPEEVEAYSKEIGWPMIGQAWCDSYQQKGWMCGKSKMKDWQAAVRNWKQNGWIPAQPAKGKQKTNSVWELKPRLAAIEEVIASVKAVLTSSYAAENKKAHPEEFAKLQELKTQRMDLLKQMGECGK